MKLAYASLRNTQGLYAPLHLKYELDVANRVNIDIYIYIYLYFASEVAHYMVKTHRYTEQIHRTN